MREEMTQIAASEYLERGYMMGAVESGEVLKEGAEAFATSEGVLVEYAAESGYVGGELLIPWADILKHAPLWELIMALPGATIFDASYPNEEITAGFVGGHTERRPGPGYAILVGKPPEPAP